MREHYESKWIKKKAFRCVIGEINKIYNFMKMQTMFLVIFSIEVPVSGQEQQPRGL